MTLADYSAMAQVVASLAVVVTIVILIVQVRENTATIKRQMLIERQGQLHAPIVESESLARIQAKVMREQGLTPAVAAVKARFGLEDDEAIRWVRYILSQWARASADFTVLGVEPRLERMIRSFSGEDAMLVWEHTKQFFPPDFQAYVVTVRRSPSGGGVRA